MNEQAKVPPEEYEKPMGKGGELPPLDLLPDREWLGARIVSAELRYSMFNNQIQYVTKKEVDPETGQEIDTPILDDNGQQIPRKEINVKFELHDYTLPNGNPRNAWLSMGAAMGEKAHLPTFLFNVVGPEFNPETPKEVCETLRGIEVKLQLKNKPNKKDPTKPPYQNVIYDAVVKLDKPEGTPPSEPIYQDPTPEQAANPEQAWDDE